ncbi:MAG: CPBP family intramembrane metalloprotease [Eubacterium sp.]|nr:CPBP family intramembrane metalloprotease [Eubacterium sp.]
MNSFLRIVKYIGGIALAFVLMSILPAKVDQWLNLQDSPFEPIITLGVIILCLAIVIVTFGQKNVFAFSFKSFRDTFIIGGTMTAVTAYYFITNMYKAVKEFGKPQMEGFAIALFLINLFISAGIREELLTRGLLFTFFRKAFGKSKASYIVAMSLSSVLFGLLHLSNLDNAVNPIPIYAQIIYAIGIGFFLAALYARTKNLWGNIILHFLFDLSLMVYPYIYANRSDMDVLIGEWLGSHIIIKSILISVVSILLGLFLIRDSKFKPIMEAEEE